jgi:hypothetical protein
MNTAGIHHHGNNDLLDRDISISYSPSGIRLKSWLIITWVWPILFSYTEAPAINCWAKRVCKEWKVEASRALWVEWWAKACKLCILSKCKTVLKISACDDCKQGRRKNLWGPGQVFSGGPMTSLFLDCMWSYCKGPSISKMLWQI